MKNYLLGLLLSISLTVFTQPTEFFGGISPQFTLGYDLNENWSINH